MALIPLTPTSLPAWERGRGEGAGADQWSCVSWLQEYNETLLTEYLYSERLKCCHRGTELGNTRFYSVASVANVRFFPAHRLCQRHNRDRIHLKQEIRVRQSRDPDHADQRWVRATIPDPLKYFEAGLKRRPLDEIEIPLDYVL